METQVKNKSFEEITRPVVEWLNENGHPHMKIVIDTTSAEITEGIKVFSTTEFLRG